MNQDEQPYFHLSKNEYGKMWLMYKPEGDGRYKCWEPVTEDFWNEFEKLLRKVALTENEELNKVINNLNEMLEKSDIDRARLRFWLGEIIRFYEDESPVQAHQFSLREAKKLL